MNKIIKALLEAKYPTVNVDSLLEVINSTPNAEVATEIICGLYKKPWVSSVPSEKFKSANKGRFEITFVEYDKWKNCVEFSYKLEKSKSIWKLKTEEKPLYSETTVTQEQYYFKDFAFKAGIDVATESDYERVLVKGDLESHANTTTCSVEEWNGELTE